MPNNQNNQNETKADLKSENDKLQKELAKLKAEKAQAVDDLAQVEEELSNLITEKQSAAKELEAAKQNQKVQLDPPPRDYEREPIVRSSELLAELERSGTGKDKLERGHRAAGGCKDARELVKKMHEAGPRDGWPEGTVAKASKMIGESGPPK